MINKIMKNGCELTMVPFSECAEEIQKAMANRLIELYDQYVAEGYDPEDVRRFILEECTPQMVADFKTRFLVKG